MCSLTAGLYDHLVAINEQVHDLQGFIHNTSAVTAQVDDQLTRTVRVIEVIQCVGERLSRALRKLIEGDIGNRLGEGVGAEDRGIAHRLHMDIFTHDGHLERLFHSLTLDLQHHGGTGIAAKKIAHFADGETFGRLAVNGQNTVACLDACALGGLAFVGINGIGPKAVFADLSGFPSL